MSIDTLMVEGPIRFDQMAAHSSLSEEEIAVLNPMYRLSNRAWSGSKISCAMARRKRGRVFDQ